MVSMTVTATEKRLANDITVYLVDDDDSVRRSLTRLLKSADWQVEAFSSPSELLERLPAVDAGCVLLDYQMPEMTGLQLQREMNTRNIFLPIVFLSGQSDIPVSVDAMKNGAVDFLVKPVSDEVLFRALEQAVEQYSSEAQRNHLKSSILARLALLSDREREVMEHVVKGRLNKQIAYDLGIAEKTVKVHRSRVMEKMAVRSLADLVCICHDLGIRETATSDQN
jgi:FixJ family two-component response regulator